MISVPVRYPHEWPVRVYYEDTDTGGVVYYANYLKFFERGRTEWLRQAGVNQSGLVAQEQLMFVVMHADISYRRPAYLDDWIVIHTRVGQLGASSITFDQQALRDDDCLATAAVRICTVHTASLKPVRLPASLRNLLEKASH